MGSHYCSLIDRFCKQLNSNKSIRPCLECIASTLMLIIIIDESSRIGKQYTLMTSNPMVSPMFNCNSSIRMDKFVHDRDRMKTPDDHFHWVAYIVSLLLDNGTQKASCIWLLLYYTPWHRSTMYDSWLCPLSSLYGSAVY